jgi:glyoxylase-like metal-dependent hydrolase (beta-lactamase superfamily II)
VQVQQDITRLSNGVSNFYLIEEGGKFILVDAGAAGDWRLFAGTMAKLGAKPEALEAVLLTHAHADHVGFAERARSSAGAAVWVHQDDAAVAKGARPGPNDGKMTAYLLRLECYRTVVGLLLRGGARIVPVKEASTFADGETLDLPGTPRVVHAPGHTPGSSALLLERQRVLLTGDSLVTRNPLTGRLGPQIMPSAFNRDTEQALRSLDIVASVPAQVLLPGHGEPWTEGAAEAARRARAAGRS